MNSSFPDISAALANEPDSIFYGAYSAETPNNDGAVSVVQNNYSPKALNSLEAERYMKQLAQLLARR